jgi:TPR repeat protein
LAAAWAAAADFKTGLDAFNRGDFTAALKEWQPIAEAGDPNAQYNLGLLYARGQGVPRDYGKAAEWYRKAADSGVAAAEYNLGVMYANGQGVERNQSEASRWFSKAAEQGVTAAQINLGRIYDEGEGASRNPAEAEKLYRQAAAQGVADAAFNLGVMYDLGQGVPRSYDEALKWYRQAADAGYAAALTNIAILYYNGQGVKRDLAECYAWLARAQKMGDPRAGDVLAWTQKNMKPADIKKGRALVDRWQPSPKAQAQMADARLFKQPQPAAANVAAKAPTAPAVSSAASPARIDNFWTGADRVIAIGDLHGDYEQFILALESAGLIDGNGNWRGGKTHVVQTGDIAGRGPDARAIMDLLMKLEPQAAAAGGGIHCLIGNHEAMNLYGDLRYVSPAEFAAFTPNASGAGRPAFPSPVGVTEPASPERDRVQAPQPQVPGYEELRQAYGPSGKYGKWIRSHNAMIKIDRTLFVHAGLGPKYLGWTLDRIDNEVRAELNDLTRLHGGVVTDPEGPLWYNGLAKGDETPALAASVDALLKQFDVDRIVVGHTYAGGAVMPRFNGKVLMIDVGLSRVYDNTGKLAVLEIDKGQPFALHRGQKLELPKDERGPDMRRYLQQAAALDPKPSPLEERLKALPR